MRSKKNSRLSPYSSVGLISSFKQLCCELIYHFFIASLCRLFECCNCSTHAYQSCSNKASVVSRGNLVAVE